MKFEIPFRCIDLNLVPSTIVHPQQPIPSQGNLQIGAGNHETRHAASSILDTDPVAHLTLSVVTPDNTVACVGRIDIILACGQPGKPFFPPGGSPCSDRLSLSIEHFHVIGHRRINQAVRRNCYRPNRVRAGDGANFRTGQIQNANRFSSRNVKQAVGRSAKTAWFGLASGKQVRCFIKNQLGIHLSKVIQFHREGIGGLAGVSQPFGR